MLTPHFSRTIVQTAALVGQDGDPAKLRGWRRWQRWPQVCLAQPLGLS
jgi:hypothetical protein